MSKEQLTIFPEKGNKQYFLTFIWNKLFCCCTWLRNIFAYYFSLQFVNEFSVEQNFFLDRLKIWNNSTINPARQIIIIFFDFLTTATLHKLTRTMNRWTKKLRNRTEYRVKHRTFLPKLVKRKCMRKHRMPKRLRIISNNRTKSDNGGNGKYKVCYQPTKGFLHRRWGAASVR